MKNFYEKLKNPPAWLCVLTFVLTVVAIALALVLVISGVDGVIAYISYGFSAIMLAYAVYIIVRFSKNVKQKIITVMKKYKITAKMLENFGYRKFVFLTLSFLGNILYAFFQATFAIISKSIWYGALAVYYIALSIVRGLVVKSTAGVMDATDRKSNLKRVKTYTGCGYSLIVLNLALVSAVVQMVVQNKSFNYAGIMIYAMAAYAFFKLTVSIITAVKAKNRGDLSVQAINSISFADSLVSIFALQTAMLQVFGNGVNARMTNAMTGGTVLLTIIALGVYMVINGKKKRRQIEEKE